MPVDRQVNERHKLLDRFFRSSEGMTYIEIMIALEEHGITVEKRTLQNDIKYFETELGACFATGLSKNRERVFRYENTDTSIFSARLSEEEKGIIEKLVEKLKVHDDNPVYQWIIALLEGLIDVGNGDLGDYVEFDNNLDLVGLEHFMSLLEACVGKYAISMKYEPYYKKEGKYIEVIPYRVKQLNGRWFLIARNLSASTLQTYAFDRIVAGSVKKTTNIAYVAPDVDEIDEGLFCTYGITGAFKPQDDKEYPVTDILLRISRGELQYFLTKPISRIQEIVEDDSSKNYVILKIEGIRINYELISLLLSKGPAVSVLEPIFLRNRIKEKIESMLESYNSEQ